MSRLHKAVLVTAATTVALLGSAGLAQAHVTVSSSTADPGAYATLTFKVPNESDTASTNELTVDLPADTPFTSVLAQDVPGWTAELVTTVLDNPVEDGHGDSITSAVTSVQWTATEGGIAPGRFATFTLSVGPLPESGTLYLPAVQQYSDGSESAWVQQAQGGAEPEHPAPNVTIGEAAGTGDAHAGHESSADGDWGVELGIAGIVLGLLAGGLAGVTFARVRRIDAAGSDSGGSDRGSRDHDDSDPVLSSSR